MKTKKNIAVVGCGHWGKNLVRNFNNLNALIAVCDPDLQLSQHYANDCGVKNLTFDEINKDSSIQGVVLAVPAPLHASMAIEAMNSGKHVYVEKPLAMNQAEADDMIGAGVRNNVHLMVGHLLQYHPIFKTLKTMVISKEFGDLQYIYSNRLSFGKVRNEEDVIWSFAPHDISMILSLTGQDPISIRTCSSSFLQSGISDTAIIHLEFNESLRAHVAVSWAHPDKEQKLVVIGSSAMAVFDDTKPWEEKLAFYNHKINIVEGMPELKKSDVEFISVEQQEPLKMECAHFCDVVNDAVKPETDGAEGLKVLNVLTAASSQLLNEKN